MLHPGVVEPEDDALREPPRDGLAAARTPIAVLANAGKLDGRKPARDTPSLLREYGPALRAPIFRRCLAIRSFAPGPDGMDRPTSEQPLGSPDEPERLER